MAGTNMFGRRTQKDIPEANSEPKKHDALTEALLKTIAEKKTAEPLLGAQTAGKQIFWMIVETLQDIHPSRIVHTETLLYIVGSFAGFSCQMAIREGLVKTNKIAKENAFVVAQTKDGRKFFFGDLLNKYLLEDEFSVWNFTSSLAKSLGYTDIPDVGKLAAMVASKVGSADYGLLSVDEKHKTAGTMQKWLAFLWPKTQEKLELFCDSPEEWPIAMCMTIQQALQESIKVLETPLKFQILMESAALASKLNPEELFSKTNPTEF